MGPKKAGAKGGAGKGGDGEAKGKEAKGGNAVKVYKYAKYTVVAHHIVFACSLLLLWNN